MGRKSIHIFNLSVVIPTRNEENIVQKNLEKIELFISKLPKIKSYELIMSDYSTDKTPNIIGQMMKKNKHIKLVKAAKRGIGEGLRKGMLSAQHEIVLFYPIDVTYSLNTIPLMIEGITNKKVDIALGSRRVSGGYEQKSTKRKIFSLLFTLLITLLFNLRIKDTQGLLAFNKKKVDYLKKIKSSDGFFQTEILIDGKRKGLRIKEYPTIQKDRPEEESNINPFKEGWSMLKKVTGKFIAIHAKREF